MIAVAIVSVDMDAMSIVRLVVAYAITTMVMSVETAVHSARNVIDQRDNVCR